MAKRAGIVVPQFYLFDSKKSAGYFGSKRFDYQNGVKCHVLSIGSLMNKNYLFEKSISAICYTWFKKRFRR